MNEIIENKEIDIEKLIYEIRGKQIMLDSDLARLYECVNGTKTINQAVNRHLDRFPDDFYFQLTEEEYIFLRSQIGTLKNGRGKHKKYLPYVFTEQGVAMLATVLKTNKASQMSISIMRAFVTMRKYISSNLIEQKYINNQVLKNTEEIKTLQESFRKFEEKRKDNEIYFNGQIFDAYSKIHDIFKTAKREIIVVDAYADNTLLDIIKRLDIKVTIITKKDNFLTKQDIIKYKEQYNNLEVIYDNSFHDRYFIIDEIQVYHCGTSINRIGYKTFSISLVGDDDVKELLINRVNNIIKDEVDKNE